jgi:hypothetical protein
MAESYYGNPLSDAQCEDLLEHLTRTLSANGMSHLIISIEENLAFIAPSSSDGEQPFLAETDEYPTTIFKRLLYYLNATIEYLLQTSSHQLDTIREQLNAHLISGEVTDIVVEHNDIVDGNPNQVSISELPNYLELTTELQQIRDQIIIYRRNGQ